MPFIHTRTNVKITKEQEISLKEQFGKAISLIRGKSESWLMLEFDDECKMYFRGDGHTPCAMVDVSLYGGASPDEYDALTEKITEVIFHELNIGKGQIYIKYNEIEYWGYNGHNF